MRVVALIAVVALLVAGGFWLARDRGAETPSVTTPASSPADTAATDNGATDNGAPPRADAPEPDAEGALAAVDGPASADSPVASDAQDAAGEAIDVDGAAESEAGAADVQDEAQPDAPADGDPVSEPTRVEDAELDLASLLPVGYSAVDFVSDEPRRLFENPEQVLEPGTDYVALLHTNRGDLVVDLYEDRTPATVNNFVFLSLNRYYQGVPFHRVLDGFMAQTGDPTGTGSGGPGYQFDDEIVDGLAFDSVGQLAMANAGAGTNGSQFFITFAATAWLTGAHTIFGEVMSGVEVLDTLTRIDPASPSAIVLPTDTV
ncbi:MAG TPA: peptidylprolyl isomerase, partial [Trueperaceae bacterium]|nr:peptidylprolyl isomerase [Trueperaceae bacterium]